MDGGFFSPQKTQMPEQYEGSRISTQDCTKRKYDCKRADATAKKREKAKAEGDAGPVPGPKLPIF